MKPIKIDLGKCTPVARSIMTGRGASRHSMRLSLTLDESAVLPSMHERRRAVPPTAQLAGFRRSWDSPSGSWWMAIGSSRGEDLALAAAVGLMWRSAVRYAENPATNHRPLLWPLYGGSHDRLRDRDEFRSGIGDVGMLILTNLADNSSREKIEKCRDLLTMYADVPRVVTVAGCDPLTFAIEQLRMSPTRVLHLGRRERVTQI